MFGQIQHLTAQFNEGLLDPVEYRNRVVLLLIGADDDDIMQFSRAIELVQV